MNDPFRLAVPRPVHGSPQLVLVNGALADVTWSEADGGRVAQRLA